MCGVHGQFERGDLIDLVTSERQLVARGLVRFSKVETDIIKGCHSSEIATLLDFDCGSEVLHRDDLVLF